MKNRILSLFLTVVMVVSCIPYSALSVFAETDSTISIENKSTLAGTTVDVNVILENNPGIAGAKIKIAYDGRLTLTKVTNGTALAELDYTAPALINPCYLNWDSLDQVSTEDGVIATLTFTVPADMAAGELKISCSYSKGDIYDTDLNDLDFNTVDGTLTIVDYIPGDANSDGVVNGKDVTVIRRYNAGHSVEINMAAADPTGDGSVNGKDVTLIRRYNAGYDVTLRPSPISHVHSVEAVAAKEATCTVAGNIAYWRCTLCDKYYDSESCDNEISKDSTVIAPINHEGHIIVHPAKSATETEIGWNEWSECTVCGYQPIPYAEIPVVIADNYTIIYYIKGGNDAYLDSLVDAGQITNPNPSYYPKGQSYALKNLAAPEGYVFEGWYDGFGDTATKITTVPANTVGEFEVYAKWSLTSYDITYSVYSTPIQPVSEERYLTYTTNKGLLDLPNPDLYNYIFLGWYLDDGTEVNEIPVGTTGDIKLNGYFTSKRNLAKSVGELKNPLIIENMDEDVIYFTYELGTIENVPVSDVIWRIDSVAGLEQKVSEEVSTSIGTEQSSSIRKSIEQATVNSSTWTLSEDWNNSTQINEEYAESLGLTVEEAEAIAKSNGNSYSITDSTGGSSTTSTSEGVTALSYKSATNKKDNSNTIEKTQGWNVDTKVSGSYETSATVEAGVKAEIPGVGSASASASATTTYKVSAEISGGMNGSEKNSETYSTSNENNVGTENSNVTTNVSENSSTWNSSSTMARTEEVSQSSSVSKAVSDIVSNTYGYGKSYATGGAKSDSRETGYTQSDSNDYTTALTYNKSEIKKTTTTYTADGKIEGSYRLVIAGTVHVFGVVGYDISTNSFFAYTYNVMDEEFYEFLDYTPKDGNFDDCEYSVVPFEIPYFVNEYINSRIVSTEGLSYTTDSTTKTATVTDYRGTETDVIVPEFISSGNIAYRVTSISDTAFAGKNIRSIILGRGIEEITADTFKDCLALEEVFGHFTVIRDEAFSGCTALTKFVVSNAVTSVGTDAFMNVPTVTVKALSKENALQKARELNPDASEDIIENCAQTLTQQVIESVANSGAKSIILDISETILCDSLDITVPEIDYFEIQGGKRSYSNVIIVSDAKETVLSMITINNTDKTPLKISSQDLTLDTTVLNSTGFAMKLKADNTTVSLIRDNHVNSEKGMPIVAKNCEFVSVVVERVSGYIKTSGDIYVCGTVTGTQNALYKEIILIDKTLYKNYIDGVKITFDANGGTVEISSKDVYYGDVYGMLPIAVREGYIFNGWYTAVENGTLVNEQTPVTIGQAHTLYALYTRVQKTLTYNANGGVVTPTSKSVYYGETYGTLPTPTRDYYNFVGWYTEAEGGNLVSPQYIMGNADVTVYAHWELKPVSGWSLESGVPSGAQIVNTKWTYTLMDYTTNSSSELSGWNLYDTKITDWSDWSAWSTADPSNGVRNVESQSVYDHTEYHYYRWTDGLSVYTYRYNNSFWLEEQWFTYVLPATSQYSALGYVGEDNSRYWWVRADFQNNYSTDRTFTRDIYRTEYRYQEPIYTYYFYRHLQLEAATDPTGQQDVSNVVKYVQYREK